MGDHSAQAYLDSVKNFINIAKEELGSYVSWADDSKLDEESTKVFESFILALHLSAVINYGITLPFPTVRIISDISGNKTINLSYNETDRIMMVELVPAQNKVQVACLDEFGGYSNATMDLDKPRLAAFLFLWS